MTLAERDDTSETLLLDRADEPFSIGVEIGTLRREPNRLDTGALQDLAKDPRVEGIAVVNQIAGGSQTAIDRPIKRTLRDRRGSISALSRAES